VGLGPDAHLDLLLHVYERDEVPDAGQPRRPPRAPLRVRERRGAAGGVSVAVVPAVLAEHPGEVDEERYEAGDAADEEEAPEAAEAEAVGGHVAALRRARARVQPLVVDALQVAVLGQRQDRRREVNGERGVALERLYV
jgi:hypothetical protein